MWLEYIFLSLCLFYIFGAVSTGSRWRREKLQSGPRNKEATDCMVLRDLGFWELALELPLFYFFRWTLPTYDKSAKLAQKYGPLLVVKARKLLQIPAPDYVNSIDLKASKLIMTSSSWPDKFYENHYLFKASFGKPYGVLFGGGKYYKRASKLAFKLLHQFEFFKPSRMEGLVVFEATEAASALEQRVAAAAAIPAEKDNPDHMQEEGKDGRKWLTLCPHTMFERNTLNIIWQVVASSRFDKDDDPIFEKLMALMNRFNRTFELPNSILEVFPILRHFPSLTVLGSLYECSNFYYKVFREIIGKKREDLSSYHQGPRDLVDGFILEIDKSTDREYLNDEQLLTFMRDLVFAGADTVNSSLEHAILLLALNPHVQARVQAEIDRVIGHDRTPVYADKGRMPYTQATLLEILRLGAPVPATARSAKSGCKLGNVCLKRGTMFAVNIYGIHRSKELWEDPEVCRPERFLSPENNSIVNVDKILPFGYGRRSCLGESVANVGMFIFFVTLFRKFEFRLSEDHPEPCAGNIRGLSRCPQPYYVKVAVRTQLADRND